MDSRLKLILNGDPEEVLMLLVRLKNPGVMIRDCEVVTQFGDVITCRVQRKHLLSVYNSPDTFSVKAPRLIPAPLYKEEVEPVAATTVANSSRRFNLPYTGEGIYVAAIDWGFDVAHANLRYADGTTKFKCIWDQNGPYDGNRYGYGCVYEKEKINAALQTDTPYQTLGYHPGKADMFGSGMHGTHVVDIATGTPVIGEGGVAPEAKLIGVQLGNNFVNGSDLALGDSVRLNEALDFIRTVTEDAPCVINMSLGSQGDSHTGKSLVEISLDNFLTQFPGYAIVQSVGNYYSANCHLQHTLKQGETFDIEWNIPRSNPSPNEVEIWYPGVDQFSVRLIAPDDEIVADVDPFEDIEISYQGTPIGYIFHRSHEPNTHLNHIDIILDASVGKGKWIIQITGTVVTNGAFNAYCERNDAGQARFSPHQSSPYTTTGSICNGQHTITVGAYDHNHPSKPVVRFSSSGPTATGGAKPDLLAPGYKISAAKSAPLSAAEPTHGLTVKSGSSMATPHVSGCIALLFQKHLPERLSVKKTKELLLHSLDPLPAYFSADDRIRAGNGLLNITKLLASKNDTMDIPNITRPVRRSQAGIEVENVSEHADAAPFVQEGSSSYEAALVENEAGLPENINEGPWEAEAEWLTVFNEAPNGDHITSFDVYRHFHPLYSFNYSPYGDRFVPIGLPNKRLTDGFLTGDAVLVRLVLSGKNYSGVITDPQLLTRDEINGALSNSQRPGYYIQAYGNAGRNKNERVYLRVADTRGIIPDNVIVLRRSNVTAGATESAAGEDAADIKEFPLKYVKYGKGGGYMYGGDKSLNYEAIFSASGFNDAEIKMARHFLETEGSIDSINTYDNQIITWGFGFAGKSGNLQIALFDLFSANESAKNDFNSFGITLASAAKRDLSISTDSGIYNGDAALRFWKESKPYLNILISLTQKYAADAFAAQWRTFKKIHRVVFAAFDDSSYLANISSEVEKNKAKTAILHAHHHYPGFNPPRTFKNAASFEEVLGIYVAQSSRYGSVQGHADSWRRSINRIFDGGSSGVSESAAGDTPVEQDEWNNNANIQSRYPTWQAYKTVRDKVISWGISTPAPYIEAAISEWNNNTSIHTHFGRNFDGDPHRSYLNLKRLYEARGITDPAGYINSNIVSITFFNRTTPGHQDLQTVLAAAQTALTTAGNTFTLDSGTWSFVPRTFNNNINRLSNHALGKAIDINPRANPHILSADEILVINTVCSSVSPNGLLATTDPDVLRNASVLFQQTFNAAWIAQQTDGDLLRAIRRRRTQLNGYANRGFLNLPTALIAGLQSAGLNWGGSWRSAKDFMHFELPNP
jgi:subtilisin family serine protease